MIKANITTHYPNHPVKTHESDLYIADYSQKTKYQPIRRATEIQDAAFVDIEYFFLKNPAPLNICSTIYNQNSFILRPGRYLSHCECSIFPDIAVNDSWILFVELKYLSDPANNPYDLRKALSQLLRTRRYYLQKGVISSDNPTYLFASIPKQSPPFVGFSLTQEQIKKYKEKFNISIFLKNDAEIVDDKYIISM